MIIDIHAVPRNEIYESHAGANFLFLVFHLSLFLLHYLVCPRTVFSCAGTRPLLLTTEGVSHLLQPGNEEK